MYYKVLVENIKISYVCLLKIRKYQIYYDIFVSIPQKYRRIYS